MAVVGHANGCANEILQLVNNGQRVRQYADMYEYAYQQAQEHILLAPPERAYNIVRALTLVYSARHTKP